MPIRRLAMIVALVAAPACAATQLTGEWQVEDIGGGGIIDSSHVTLDFSEAGRIAGSGGCNRYTAALAEDGGGLTIGPAAATRMACPEALMNQEQRFFDALSSVERYERDGTGALLLFASDGAGPVIVARQR